MATTINSYSVGFGMDASSYIKGANLSRQETRSLVRDIESARSPTEKYTIEQNRLSEAYKKGAIDLATYNRLLADKKKQLGLTTASFNPYTIAIGAAAAAGTAAIGAGVAFVAHLRDVQGQIDETVKAGAKLGMTYNEVSQLRFAAAEIGGMDPATVDASVKKMMINISKAVQGDEGMNKAFATIGLNAGDLMKAGPVEAVKMIADGMQGVNDQGDKLKLAMGIFGKAGTEFVDTLSAGRTAIEESAAFQEKWAGLTTAQTLGVEANNDAWGRISTIVGGVSTKLAAEFAPVMQLVADYILEGADSFGTIDTTIKGVVDTSVYMVGVFKDVYELVNVTNTVLQKMTMLDFSGAGDAVKDALDFGSGEKALKALYDKRFELSQQAAAKERERDEKRKNMHLADIEETTEAKIEGESDVEKERKRLLAEEEKRQDQLAKKSLDQARKALEEDAKRQKKMRDDVSKGPGAGMEAGSAEAAKFMADQVNAAIGAATVPDLPTPGEAELIREAQRQLELLKKQEETQQKMLEQIKQNGFARIR
jgi:hypothetical protein